jgi:hypothetical protein
VTGLAIVRPKTSAWSAYLAEARRSAAQKKIAFINALN